MRLAMAKQVRMPAFLWLEALIFVIGIGLYAFQLGAESLWIDEMLSIGSARGPLDLNRPLYFVLLRGWLRVGENEVWLRSLSVLFGLASLSLTYWLGCRLVSRSVGLVAALLFALSPLAINHAQEVRFYIMSACLGVAGSLFLSDCFRDARGSRVCGSLYESNARGRKGGGCSGAISLGGWIVCRCLGFLTAQPNLLLIVPDFLLIGWTTAVRSRQQQLDFRKWRWALVLLAVPTAIILKDTVPPLIDFLLNQKWYAGAARAPTVTNLVGLLAALTAWPLAGPEELSGFYQPIFKLYAGLILAGSLLPVLYKKLRSPQLVWLAFWGFLPVVLVFCLSQVFPFLWLERYAVISIPYIAILLAASWVWLWERRKEVAVAIALFYLIALSGPLLRYYTTDYRADWRGLSQEMELLAETGDLAVVYPSSFLPYIDYYYEGKAELIPIEEIDSFGDVDAALLAQDIEQLTLANRRFWLVCPIKEHWNSVREDVFEELAEKGFVLERTSARVDHWNWGPVLYLFERRSA